MTLEELLKKSSFGKKVLASYKKNPKRKKNYEGLTEHDRNKLVDIIIDDEIKCSLDKCISGKRFIEIAEAIVELFPKENKLTYIFITENGQFVAGHGKLYRRWSNTRREMIKLGLISINKNKRKRNEDNESVESENDGSTITLESLKDLDVPLNEFLVLWKATFDERRNLLQNYDFEIYNYLSEFFAFKDDRGYLLVCQMRCYL
ncbi:uncharacterized protein LOC141532297 [Cotesia typhae]|uniref:uncharacterized protein LOC141532297 n=1 Tax=Cotesia typhae TaxID=2053667 RepID=UPI003D69F99A